MKKELKPSAKQELINYIKTKGRNLSIYIGVDVGKNVLDIGVTIQNSDLQIYLGTIENTAIGFKEIEELILELIMLGVNENNIFFGTENTGIYGHDIMNYFDDRLPNTYMLNSSLTCNARKYYAKSDFKSDNIDAIIIAITLRDLDNKNQLESINNPFRKSCGLGFVRRSFSNERSSLRILFRRLCLLRSQKSKLMTSINLSKERLFPEINGIFSIKHRASSESILLNHFSRNEILRMSKKQFIQKYKSIATKGQSNSRVMLKVEDFYDKITTRGSKDSRSDLDRFMGKNSDTYLLQEIKFKLKHYDLTCKEMKAVTEKISDLLDILKKSGYYIPRFTGINDIEIGLILGELGFDIYQMNSKEFIGFVGWYPENYTSGGGHMVKPSRLSNKKGIIKKFVYIRMYGFQLHNLSFRLYKKLLSLYYGINDESFSVIALKNKRKVEVKCGEKLLQIIHDGYKNRRGFDEEKFIETTVSPLITKMKSFGINDEAINDVIFDVYKNRILPRGINIAIATPNLVAQNILA